MIQGVSRLPLELADYIAPAVELAGFAALLRSRRAWHAWLASLIFFHSLVNDLVLNIWFPQPGHRLLGLL